jgi:hypothetical protein
MRTIRDWMMILIFDFYSYSHVPRARTFAMFFCFVYRLYFFGCIQVIYYIFSVCSYEYNFICLADTLYNEMPAALAVESLYLFLDHC